MKSVAVFLVVILSATAVFAEPVKSVKDTVTTEAGRDVVVVLASNRAAGYSWQLAKPVNTELIPSHGVKYLADGDSQIGHGGKELWSFKTIKPGKTKIFLKYVKAGSQNRWLAPMAVITVIIR